MPSADLTVALSAPVSASVLSPFTDTVVITNLGPGTADGATFAVAVPVGASGIVATCTAAGGGAVCPAPITVAAGTVSGTIGTLPASGTITLTLTGQFGGGASASVSATVTEPATAMDPDPATNSATHTTTLVPRTAAVSVATTTDTTAAPFGQTVTFVTTLTNNGPDDLVGLHVDDHFHSLKVGAQNSLSLTGTQSCDMSAANPAPCPAGLVSPVPYTGTLNGSDLPVVWPTVDLPSGTSMRLTVSVSFATTHCGTFELREVENVVAVTAPAGTTLAGTTNHVSPHVALGPCTDVAIQVAISSPSPRPGDPLTTTMTVSNTATQAVSSIPFVLELPDRGGLAVDPSKVACAIGPAPVTCPADLTYDPAKRTITGTVADLVAGGRFTLRLEGRAGVVPAQKYTVTASIRLPGNVVAGSSTISYPIVNTRARITASFALQGGVGSRALVFSGTLSCALQGSVPFTVTIPAGQTRTTATLSSAMWLRDDCKASVTRIPRAPEGYLWESGGHAPAAVSSVAGVRVAAFTFVLRPDPSTASPAAAGPSTAASGQPATTTSDAAVAPSMKAATQMISVVTGDPDTRADSWLAVVGALVLAAGIGLAARRP